MENARIAKGDFNNHESGLRLKMVCMYDYMFRYIVQW